MPRFATAVRAALRDVIGPLVAQATPLLFGQLATSAYGIIDLLLLGHLSGDLAPHSLAVFGVSWNIFNTLQIGFAGVLIALIPMASRSHGARRPDQVAHAVRQGAWLALVLSAPICAGLLLPGPLLALSGQSGAAADEIRLYLAWLAASVPALLLFRVVSGYASAVLDNGKVLLVNLAGLALKAPLAALLVLGPPGIGGWGVTGCAMSTAVVAWVVLGLGLLALRADRRCGGRLALAEFELPRMETLRTLLRQGIPIGLSFFFDYSALTIIGLLIARSGQTLTAAHGIAANVSYLCYLVPMSLATVASALVGQALGRSDGDGAVRAGRVALTFAALLGASMALALAAASGIVAGWYTSDGAVAAGAARLITLVAVYHAFDAVFTVASGVLRGHQRTLVPTAILGTTLWGIGLGGGGVAVGALGAPDAAVAYWSALAVAAAAAAAGVVAYLRQVAPAPTQAILAAAGA